MGRVAAMIGDGVSPLDAPSDIIIVRAGVDTGFAALGALTTLAILSRREVLLVADGLAAAALAGLGGWHAGCLARDACLGTPSDLPWAYSLDGSTITRHPVELYAALLFLLAASAVAIYKAYGRPASLLSTGLALASAGLVRLITEPMRASLLGGPESWYVLAIVAGSTISIYGVVQRRRVASPVSHPPDQS